MEPDFSGYVTKAGIKCTDGRTIMPKAFEHMNGTTVPLVWHHRRDEPANVLGHVQLEARADGMYGYGFFNETPAGANSKALVLHGDVKSLSIYANRLKETSTKNVIHGQIIETSLVLSGANSGAVIDFVRLAHSDGDIEDLDDEAVISMKLELEHSGNSKELEEPKVEEDLEHAEDGDTVKDIFDTMNEDQQKATLLMMAGALEAAGVTGDAEHSGDSEEATTEHTEEEGSPDMTRNVFDQTGQTPDSKNTLTHAQRVELFGKVIESAKKDKTTFKDAFLEHAVDYGIENIDFLFPDAKNLTNAPELIARRMEWVTGVLSSTKKSPFSRIKTMSADITHDEARAKGYVKGNLKKEEWFALAKRITTPQTIYKKQKLDRDDIIDITDLDVVAWLKAEMRLMLDEELARAVLVGDGREPDDDDKIVETNIRPIAYDDDFYNEKITIPTNVVGDALVEAVLRARPKYRGTGNPDLYLVEDLLTDLLLVKDKFGRRLYETTDVLARAMRVNRIIVVDVMEDLGTDGGDLLAIMVNLTDYTLGADRGGAISFFDDFDIDYNQYKYLIETRVSGALTKFKSAVTFSRAAGTLVTANITVPTFVNATGVLTVPTQTGVQYYQDGVLKSAGAQTAIAAGTSTEVEAKPASGYIFKHNIDTDWTYTRDA